jgi:hypothetical protein
MVTSVARGERGPVSAVNIAAAIVLGFALANLLFNAGAVAAGAGYPYNSFLFRPSDRFADFFKLAFSYPGQPVHHAAGFWQLDELLAHHQYDVRRFEGTIVNHFHVPPLPTLLGLVARRLAQWVDPVALFLGLLITALAALFTTVLRLSPRGRAGAGLATIALLSYPTILFIDRGHFFSLICGTLIIAATLRTLRDGKTDAWGILMFAVALNIRPNAGIIPLALFLGKRGLNFRDAVLLGTATLALFAGCLWSAHALYPDYSLDSFLAGLRDYGKVYAAGDIGYPGGSSLYGMLRALFGFGPWMYGPPLFVAGILLAPAIMESRQGRLRQSECLFLVLCAYALGSHIFADYHLLVFVVPLVLLALECGVKDRSAWAILLASSLVLAPKNFAFVIHGNLAWSWQVVANPLILLVASVVVVGAAVRRHRSQAAPEIVAAAA